ncbi:MAG TPA: UDP-N-acetylmuramate--L-alanine ligase [Bacteroidia bacterium]|jgi:UDP-N-acetylmuramate--alanine ligase
MKDIKHIYFLGIGGIGMSALARYFKAMGKNVAGYDKTPTKLTDELITEGINIHFEDNIDLVDSNFKSQGSGLKSQILIVYTPAVPKDHSEYVFFNNNGFNIKKRAEVLGLITESARTIAVAGTHGKTTTSSLVAHILKTAGLDPSAFLGGITQNYNTNLLLSKGLGDSDKHDLNSLIVVEADEYDRSFLTLHPEIAVITSVDADHLDIYGDKGHVEESFSMFADLVSKILIVKKNIQEKVKSARKALTYSVDDHYADYYAMDIKIREGYYHYDIQTPKGVLKNVTMGLPGKHNVENSIAAVAIACQLNIADVFVKEALRTFGGVRRRFDYQVKSEKVVYIDDYAHHPEELKATISSAREMYPGKKITGIFQPHLFSRTRDFADDFAASLDLLDECILLEVYPAREQPIPGIDSSMLLGKMRSGNKKLCTPDELLSFIGTEKLDVLLTMGAGDIDKLVEPIRKKLSSSNEKV